jgi:hypothetical protein
MREGKLWMNIAYLGWGSLIWKKRVRGRLKIVGSWEMDGPFLPIEFARISDDQTVTLVLHPDAQDVQTLWAKAITTDIETAIQDLKVRENTSTDNIGFVCIPDSTRHCTVIPTIWEGIEQWAKHKGLDAVVWTDLPSKFKEVAKMDFNEENVVKYIFGLPPEILKLAEKYVRKAPKQIETSFRRRLKAEFTVRKNLEKYRDGFWLDKNTLIKTDDVKIQMVKRKILGSSLGKSENAPMLILTNVIEMMVDDKGKIKGVDKHPQLGLWLDAVNKAIRNQVVPEPKLGQ